MHNHHPPRNQLIQNWTPDIHLDLYAAGYFPMADHNATLDWYAADPRATLPLTTEQGLHIPRSLKRILKKPRFTFTTNHAFERVIRACAHPRTDHADDIRWLTEPIIDACIQLHELGHAHSLEAWTHDPATNTTHLAGGIYGLSIGSVFFAESMFHARHPNPTLDGSNASNAALITLAAHLYNHNYTLLDIQFPNPHTERFGIINIQRAEFLTLLAEAVAHKDRWRPLPSAPPPGTIEA